MNLALTQSATVRDRLRLCVDALPHFGPIFLKLLALCPPARSVQGAARAASCSVATLERRFRNDFGERADCKLKRVLDLLILLRAAEIASPNVPWHVVAETVGVSEKTLRRMSARGMRLTLAELRKTDPKIIGDRLLQNLIHSGAAIGAEAIEGRNILEQVREMTMRVPTPTTAARLAKAVGVAGFLFASTPLYAQVPETDQSIPVATAGALSDIPVLNITSPVTVVGRVDGNRDYIFDRITGAVRFPNGNIAVASQGSFNVRIYDRSGRYLTAFGREGPGPQEFSVVGALLRCGEYALAVAPDRNIGYILKSDGTYVGELRIRPNGWRLRPKGLACNSAWQMLATGWGVLQGLPEGPHRPRVPVAVVDSSGDVVGPLGNFNGEERYRHTRSDGPMPLGKRLVYAVSGKYAIVGEGDAPSLQFFSLTGHPNHFLTWEADDDRFTASDRRRFIELNGKNPRDRRFYESLDYPEAYPPYYSIHVDESDRLWVQRYPHVGDEVTKLLLFSASGAPQAQVDVNRRLEVHGIHDGYLVGTGWDELGVEYVYVYALPPGVK